MNIPIEDFQTLTLFAQYPNTDGGKELKESLKTADAVEIASKIEMGDFDDLNNPHTVAAKSIVDWIERNRNIRKQRPKLITPRIEKWLKENAHIWTD